MEFGGLSLIADGDVNVSAIRPQPSRPLVRESGGETETLAPVGRPPNRRYRRTVAIGLAVVALAFAVGRFAFEKWDGHRLHSGGPVSAGSGINGAAREIGEPTIFRALVLENDSKHPAVLEDFRVLGVSGGFEITDVSFESVTGDPASVSSADRHVVPPAPSRTASGDPDNALRVAITARPTTSGVARARGVEITYRVGHRRYRRTEEGSMYLCAPRDQFTSQTCPGDAKGQFSDVTVDFPLAG